MKKIIRKLLRLIVLGGAFLSLSALPATAYMQNDSVFAFSMTKGQMESTLVVGAIIVAFIGLNGMASDNHNEIARNGIVFGAGLTAIVFIPIYFEF